MLWTQEREQRLVGRRKDKWKKKHSRRTKPRKTSSEVLLDEFTAADVRIWGQRFTSIQELNYRYYYCLHAQRASKYQEICQSLKNNSSQQFKFNDWHRVVNYEYSLTPLSYSGSLRWMGGRFNYGQDIDDSQFYPFPCFYIAEDFETAYREKYGLKSSEVKNGLTSEELAQQKNNSFSAMLVKGEINNIFDLTITKNLNDFLEITKKFTVSKEIIDLARMLNLKKPIVAKTSAQLKDSLLIPNWRGVPVELDVPSNPQVFGKILLDCGFEGVLYPSTKGSKKCLAIFVENLVNSSSFVDLSGQFPDDILYQRLDSQTWKSLG